MPRLSPSVSDGYKQDISEFTTFGETFLTVPQLTTTLQPLLKRKVKIMVYDSLDEEPRELKKGEKAFIELNNYDGERLAYSTFVISGKTNDIEITAEKYSIEGDLYKEGEFKIKKKVIKKCAGKEVDLLGWDICIGKKEEVTIPARTLDVVSLGGISIDEYEFDRTELDLKEEIVFYLYNFGIPTTYDDLTEKEKPNDILPELK